MPGFHRHAIDDPADSVTQIITVEEYDGTLQQIDHHAGDGFGLGVPMQFVESDHGPGCGRAVHRAGRAAAPTNQMNVAKTATIIPKSTPNATTLEDRDEREDEFDVIGAPDLDECTEI